MGYGYLASTMYKSVLLAIGNRLLMLLCGCFFFKKKTTTTGKFFMGGFFGHIHTHTNTIKGIYSLTSLTHTFSGNGIQIL